VYYWESVSEIQPIKETLIFKVVIELALCIGIHVSLNMQFIYGIGHMFVMRSMCVLVGCPVILHLSLSLAENSPA